MRAAVSTTGSPAYGTSKYLVKTIQATLNKNKHRVLNSSSFVEDAKKWNISPSEIQTSFDVANLSSFVEDAKKWNISPSEIQTSFDVANL